MAGLEPLPDKAQRKNKRLRNRAIFVRSEGAGGGGVVFGGSKKWSTSRLPAIIAGRIEITAVFMWDLPPFRRIG